MTTMTPQSWATDLLTRMHYPVTANNLTSVLAWEYGEGGHFANAARFNPLNTTMAHTTYGSINSVGVATYPDYETGMLETIATLKLPAYSTIRHDLAADASPARTATAVAASPWGTWHGVKPDAALARARADVAAHPDWVPKKTSGANGSGGTTPPSSKPGSTKPGAGKGGASTPGAGKGGATKVVLDLAELQELSGVYRDAHDRVLQTRRAVQDIAHDIEQARAALPNTALGTALAASFAAITDPAYGLDRDARLADDLSVDLANIRRLAQEADADHDGKWSKKEATAFLAKHPKGTGDPALRAVSEAVVGGSIVKGAGKGAAAAGSTVGGAAGTRKAKVDKLLAFARTQHATDGGDNHTKYGKWYGTDGVKWCAQFVSYVFAHSGNQLPSIDGTPGKGFQYCPDAIAYARAHGQLHETPKVGDIFLRRDGQHTGIVTAVHANGTFDTVEGNAGPATDRVANGNRVVKGGTYWFWTAIH